MFLKDNLLADMKSLMKEKDMPLDVGDADDMLKRHYELKDEIEANRAK